eukprot:TRINITY_DN6907_c0_g1_i3.p1 TRINITY_DN6907_c0_g1~~TRINITY_DN6907_c0_g1_i3.p1  ORF type:complete len:184 (+),score=19.30 TRINITY_DN6907_c0_g1_i3:272-823(+)
MVPRSMMVRTKDCAHSMVARDRATNGTIRIALEHYLDHHQVQRTEKHPPSIVQFAHYISRKLARQKPHYFSEPPAIHGNFTCSFNGRPFQNLISPVHDLSQIDYNDEPFDWVTPLEPLPEEKRAEYPWRWPWTFRWLWDEWPTYVKQYEALMSEKRRLRALSSFHLPGTHSLSSHRPTSADTP